MHGLSCFTLLCIRSAFSCTVCLVSHCCELVMPFHARTDLFHIAVYYKCLFVHGLPVPVLHLCVLEMPVRARTVSVSHCCALEIPSDTGHPFVTLSQVSYSCPYFSVLIVYSRLLRLSPPPLLLNISQTNLSRVSNPIDRLYHVSYCQGYDGKAGVSIKTA